MTSEPSGIPGEFEEDDWVLVHLNGFKKGREAERAKIVAWLRGDNSRCDCAAFEEYECACGGWNDYKSRPLLDTANAIEAGEHLK